MIRNPHRADLITIPRTEYDKLLKCNDMLQCLEAGGVDNWTWYSDSLKPHWKRYYPEDYEGED